MKVKCLNCGNEFELNEIYRDELGDHMVCPECGCTFDVETNKEAWTFKDLIELASKADVNKPIIIVVGGTQVYLKHAYIATENELEEFGTVGNLIIDLDV